MGARRRKVGGRWQRETESEEGGVIEEGRWRGDRGNGVKAAEGMG